MKYIIITLITLFSFSLQAQSDSLDVVPEKIEVFKKASESKLEIETTTSVHLTIREIKEKLKEYDQAVLNLRAERQIWRDRLAKAGELDVKEEPEKDGE